MHHVTVPVVLTIAGSDPSGGAGIQADIKAISATGSYAASIITALTAQNTQGVFAIESVSAGFVQKQSEVIFEDLDVQAVKIGMLQDERIIEVIARELARVKPKYVVCDPVMVAKDGSVLLDLGALSCYKEKLLPEVHLITPNLFEAEHLLGQPIKDAEDMEAAAITLGQRYDLNVLVKGGHLDSSQSADVLYLSKVNRCHWFYAERIRTKNTHGTGCSLSSAIASFLAQGMSMIDAIRSAKRYLTEAIRVGAKQQIGQGAGPVDHFHFLSNRNKITQNELNLINS